MSAKLLWYGTAASAAVFELAAKKVERATDVLHGVLVKRVSGPSPSAEGGYPGIVTGEFAGSIVKEFSKKKLEGRVGSNLDKAAWLEFGTHRHGPRPWLTLIVEEMKSKMKGIVLSRRT